MLVDEDCMVDKIKARMLPCIFVGDSSIGIVVFCSYSPWDIFYSLFLWNLKYILLLFNTFSIPLQRLPSLEGRHINEKVLLKLSSCNKSRKFETGMKMIAIAPTHLIYIHHADELYIPLGVGLLFYPFQRQCESLLRG